MICFVPFFYKSLYITIQAQPVRSADAYGGSSGDA